MMRLALKMALVVFVAGCVSYQNPGPSGRPTLSVEELAGRLPIKVGIRMPTMVEFQAIPNEHQRQLQYDLALSESKRLLSILTDCQVLQSVSAVESSLDSYDAVIVALPRSVGRTDLDDPWLLLYGGVIPSYSKNERGISFRFEKGGHGDVLFKWTESLVVGLWAPFVSASGEKWMSSRKSTTYWQDLRAEMLRVFLTPPGGSSANNSLQRP
jgi:hypothetical protein